MGRSSKRVIWKRKRIHNKIDRLKNLELYQKFIFDRSDVMTGVEFERVLAELF